MYSPTLEGGRSLGPVGLHFLNPRCRRADLYEIILYELLYCFLYATATTRVGVITRLDPETDHTGTCASFVVCLFSDGQESVTGLSRIPRPATVTMQGSPAFFRC